MLISEAEQAGVLDKGVARRALPFLLAIALGLLLLPLQHLPIDGPRLAVS
ncbi:MAG: hypothetical protein JWM90_2419, partial [Thermoleophilia bacterium]|nr:hypothetical protein [Thermoleophilia bacterium]